MVLEFAEANPLGAGADEIWTKGVTAGEDVNVPSMASCQPFTTYLAAVLLLCSRVGTLTALKPTRDVDAERCWRLHVISIVLGRDDVRV